MDKEFLKLGLVVVLIIALCVDIWYMDEEQRVREKTEQKRVDSLKSVTRLRTQRRKEQIIQDAIEKEETAKRVYETKKVNEKEWMIFNLNNERYNIEVSKNVCPKGWYLPTDDEWFRMIKSIAPTATKRKGLISKGLMDNPLRLGGTYWSATEYKDNQYWYYEFNEKGVFRSTKSSIEKLHCRCMKN